MNEIILLGFRAYWEILIWPPLMVFTIGLCSIAIFLAGQEIVKHTGNIWKDVAVLLGAAAILFIRRARIFCWTYVALFMLWVTIVGCVVLAIVGPQKHTGQKMSGLVALALCLPPLIATVCADQVFHRTGLTRRCD
jgi:hypothetical protein